MLRRTGAGRSLVRCILVIPYSSVLQHFEHTTLAKRDDFGHEGDSPRRAEVAGNKRLRSQNTFERPSRIKSPSSYDKLPKVLFVSSDVKAIVEIPL